MKLSEMTRLPCHVPVTLHFRNGAEETVKLTLAQALSPNDMRIELNEDDRRAGRVTAHVVVLRRQLVEQRPHYHEHRAVAP